MSEALAEAERWIRSHLGTAVAGRQSVGGGCINENYHLILRDGRELFCKTHPAPPEDFFASEARALARAAATGTLVVPEVVHAETHFLLMAWVEPKSPEAEDWSDLGEALAGLHRQIRPEFGLDSRTYCGLTPLDNTPDANGYRFFSERRLKPLARELHLRGDLSAGALNALDVLCERLPELIPEQPASLLHGDFWSGNVMFADNGPVYLDPAQYHGWREADLAMSRLFGSLSPAFYAAYNATWPLEPGFERRCDLYNLFHLLNHARLFGPSYIPSVLGILRPFTPR
ncbi:fructosamine kinase family protein [Hahella sp. SMD15-11]|uniref:Fructosamine kinase family protein n=1 Tax=Thermohahella caldifontis TaxID=3142973 RepID=A0AB39USD6_9GAMM